MTPPFPPHNISYLSRSQSIDRDICDHLLYILTIYLNFILILSINQKAIFMGSLMQWLYLERMKVRLRRRTDGSQVMAKAHMAFGQGPYSQSLR
jgi:hypothetical protein